MTDTQNGRVAVYLDFDNIVLSWYDRVHGRNSFARDRQKIAEDPTAPGIAERLRAAVVDVGAIIDYASSFGTLVLTRAYADWSAPMNAEYRSQLVARAVDLVQLFPAAAYAKNGADIRLAVDAVEDMFRLDDLTHVVIVAGDSDYVPLAQRCKRLGRYVVGIGVAGSTAKSLTAACDEFAAYDALPGIERPERGAAEPGRGASARGSRRGGGARASADSGAAVDETAGSGSSGSGTAGAGAVGSDAGGSGAEGSETAATGGGDRDRRSREAVAHAAHPGAAIDAHDGMEDDEETESAEDRDIAVTGLLIRALWLSQDKDDSGWLYSSAVKQQMRRMDPSFNEKALGFRSFSDFLKSRSDVAELEETGHERLVRLRDQGN
ncbi:NYN domain-containing protein [Leucobacter allii]|uniref:NYN domain-containing protein n=1 Tax=Leucobacter allii TaxID=2932247 RepID=A0ABY4FHZ6_9MICO|nr:NYN domain-containing protein [Leucobacter allii]UOQ56302.1 NYN domain-containing protein [Leucobacter allii]